MQEKVTKLGHVGHQGEEKTKKLLREKVWYSRMDQKVKDMIDKCIAYQAIGQSNRPEPMKLTPTDSIPWNSVATDFYGQIPNTTTQYLLVCTDLYSKFPEVEIVNSTEAESVIPKLYAMWARHGIPAKLKSDNGPPVNSQDFKTYTEALGRKWKPSTPLWPRGNANAESVMKPIGKLMKACEIEGTPMETRAPALPFIISHNGQPPIRQSTSPTVSYSTIAR